MKRTLISIMTLALTLTTWSLQAAINPDIVQVDLDIDYLATDDPTEWTPGGFVCVEGRKKITLQKVQPVEWGTTSGDSTKRVRLSWGSTKIAIYDAATGGNAVISGTDYANANLPTNFWVEGVAVSATAGTSSTPGPETILAQAIPDGMYDRISFTVYHVDSIAVMPKNAPEGWIPPEPVTIGAGAIHSPAHQADVTIQVLPAVAGIPVDVRLIRGLSYEPGKEAELDMGTQIATGGGEAVTVLTGTDGTISGDLTSSDVNNMDCTIRACATGTNVVFTWDQYSEQDEWTFEPGYLPVPGVLTNHLVLRHHRDGELSATTNGAPWEPFNGHDIRFFVEKVEYWDADGNLCETNNTADAPADLSAWATFPTNPVTTDANGRVTELLTVVTNGNLHSVTMVAYDWSVWVSPAPVAPVAPLSDFGFGPLAAPSASSEPRTQHIARNACQVTFGPHIAFQPQEVPLHEEGSSTSGFGGLLVIYLANLNANSVNWTFAIQTNTATGWSTSVPQAVAKIDQVLTGQPGGMKYIEPGLTPDSFNFYRIIVREPARYQVKIFYQSTVKWTFEFDTVAGKLDFAGLNAHDPIILTTNRLNYVLFPLTNSAMASARLVVTGKVVATLPDGSPKDIYTIGPLDAGSKFEFTPMLTPNFQMSGLSEGDNHVLGKFKIMTKGIRKKIISIADEMMIVSTDMGATEARSGSFTNMHLVCPNMHIVSPTGTLPPSGEPGATAPYAEGICQPLVFDEPDEIGKCLMACETPQLTGLSSAFVKSLVWNNVEWVHPSVSTVTSVTTNTPPGEPWKTKFRYNTMPTHNNAFGNTNLVLRFKDRHAWKWDQPVQFRFNRTGTNAATRVIAAGALSTNYVSAGNPNWYVYWQQVANGFSFGPQTTKMIYNSAIVGDGGQAGDWLPLTLSQWTDRIVMYDTNGCGIVACIETIHHENGHHQSKELPSTQGGFGSGIVWTYASDSDVDFIHDLWEANAAPGYLLGFEIGDATSSINQVWRGNWDHGWTNATGYGSCTNPPPYPDPGPYCNPDGYNPATGSGLCPRNESHVGAQQEPIRLKDWSFKGP